MAKRQRSHLKKKRMAKLYRHKHSHWQIHYRLHFPDGTTKRKWRYYPNKPHAQRFLQEIEKLEYASLHRTLTRETLTLYLNLKLCSSTEAEKLLGKPVNIPVLGGLADQLRERSKIECRPRTHAVNKIRIRHLLDFFGEGCLVSDITTGRIEDYRGHRLKLISATTVNKEIIKLAQLLDIAMEKRALVENPARKIRRLRDLRERKPRALTREEIIRLRWAARCEKKLLRGMSYPIIMTYLYTGMRREELVHLEWEDVDLEKRCITIQSKRDGFVPKTGKSRTVGIAARLGEILARMPQDGRYCFGGTSILMRGDGITHAFRKLANTAGLPRTITLHSLRHTYITHLMEAGVNPRRVQELAGHRTFATTWRYSHALPTQGVDEDKLDF